MWKMERWGRELIFCARKEEMLNISARIKVDKSLGLVGIFPSMPWEEREEDAEVITSIFVSSLAAGEIPEDWKIANIVPLLGKIVVGISQETTGR